MTSVELLRALAVFAEPPEAAHARVAGLLGLGDCIDGSAYAELFVFQLPPYASIYVGPEGWMGGEARERIAGFWRAVGRTPPAEPDHLSVLLGLYAALSEEHGQATGPAAALAAEAGRALLHEHLAPWVFAYLDHAEELAVGGYKRWAELLRETLAQAAGRVGQPAVLPAHLRAASGLPDPRTEGGQAFLKGLLAPVRSGIILTRAALGTMARELDLGLRAGERRFALEGLLGQDSQATLAALAALAAREELAHKRREGLQGESARFLARRAGHTARLLSELGRYSGSEMGSVIPESPRGRPPEKLDYVLESSLYVSDLDAAEAFYRSVLGLTLHSKLKGRHVFFRCGNQMVLLFDPEATADPDLISRGLGAHGAHGPGHLAFGVGEDEIDSWRTHLQNHGVEIEHEVEWGGERGRSLYFRDPDGNSLEVATPGLWGIGN